MREKLDDARIGERLPTVPGWRIREGRLHREFRFPDFTAAFAFMTASAIEAGKLDHHPDWSNVYATVRVDLHTHDAGGLTELDFQLARRMNELAGGECS